MNEDNASEETTTRKRRTSLCVIAVLILLAFAYVFGPMIVENILSFHLRSAFAEQDKLFGGLIASLGVTSQPESHFQCGDELHTHWQTEALCWDFFTYAYDQSPISTKARSDYPANAARLDSLLRQNGWVNDRPNDSVTTIAGSNPYLSRNNGIGGEVPFHKNTGSISCNLEIDFRSLDDPIAPAAINVNEFSCSQHVSFFMPHLTLWQYQGP